MVNIFEDVNNFAKYGHVKSHLISGKINEAVTKYYNTYACIQGY